MLFQDTRLDNGFIMFRHKRLLIRSILVLLAYSLQSQAQLVEIEQPTPPPVEYSYEFLYELFISVPEVELSKGSGIYYCGPHIPKRVIYNHDGTRMAVKVDSGLNPFGNCPYVGAVQVFDVTQEPAALLHTFRNVTGSLAGIDFSNDGTQLVTGNHILTVKFYDMNSNPVSSKLLDHLRGYSIGLSYGSGYTAFSKNEARGNRLAVSFWSGVYIFDVNRLFPDSLLGSGSGSGSIQAPKPLFKPETTTHIQVGTDVSSLAYNKSGNRLAVGTNGWYVNIFDGDTQERLDRLTTRNSTITLTYNHSGSELAVAGEDRNIRIFDGVNLSSSPEYKEVEILNQTQKAQGLAYHPHDTKLAAGSDEEIRIYDRLNASLPPTTIPLDDPSGRSTVWDVTYNDRGTRIAVAVQRPRQRGMIRVYKVHTQTSSATTTGSHPITTSTTTTESHPITTSATTTESHPITTSTTTTESHPITTSATTTESQPITTSATTTESQPITTSTTTTESQPVTTSATTSVSYPEIITETKGSNLANTYKVDVPPSIEAFSGASSSIMSPIIFIMIMAGVSLTP